MKNMNLFKGRSEAPKGRGSSGSVQGVQQKWYDPGQRIYFKLDSPGRFEGLVEYLLSCILDVMSIDNTPVSCVRYQLRDLNGTTVTTSESFLRKGERELSLSALIDLDEGLSGIDASSSIPVDTKIVSIVDAIAQHYNLLELRKFYGALTTLDYVFWNEDRHWSNCSIIQCTHGYRVAPIFDNGNALQVSIKNTLYDRKTYEPRPYNADQLFAVPLLLQSSRVIIRSSGLHYSGIATYLTRFYPKDIVSRYLDIVRGLLCSVKSSLLSGFVEVC